MADGASPRCLRPDQHPAGHTGTQIAWALGPASALHARIPLCLSFPFYSQSPDADELPTLPVEAPRPHFQALCAGFHCLLFHLRQGLHFAKRLENHRSPGDSRLFQLWPPVNPGSNCGHQVRGPSAQAAPIDFPPTVPPSPRPEARPLHCHMPGTSPKGGSGCRLMDNSWPDAGSISRPWPPVHSPLIQSPGPRSQGQLPRGLWRLGKVKEGGRLSEMPPTAPAPQAGTGRAAPATCSQLQPPAARPVSRHPSQDTPCGSQPASGRKPGQGQEHVLWLLSRAGATPSSGWESARSPAGPPADLRLNEMRRILLLQSAS